MDTSEALWRARGFEPWSHGSLAGVRRRVTVKKSSLLGEVAKYYTDDYIVWQHNGDPDCDRLFRTWRPARDVMAHRFVFIEGAGFSGRRRRTRGFLLGLRGFLEIYRYTPGGTPPRGAEDLAYLLNEAVAGRAAQPEE